MSTVIYPSPIFGPIHSRRLGISLGINLQPADGKVCSFDCIYCECGFNGDHRPTLSRPSRQLVAQKLEEQLQKMVADKQLPDVLTFAGNGEPTSHPHFAEIIDDTIRLRDQYCPQAKVCVLSNATMTHRPQVHDALMRVDDNILKLDTVNPDYIRLVDRPVGHYDVRQIIDNLKAFHGHVIIQTMFMRGTFNVQCSMVNGQCSMVNGQCSMFNGQCSIIKNCCLCALEKAYRAGKTSFCKPISCALYPIREKKLGEGLVGLNYNRWKVCKMAVAKGIQENLRLYEFLRDPLIRRFGDDWYQQLLDTVTELRAQGYLK